MRTKSASRYIICWLLMLFSAPSLPTGTCKTPCLRAGSSETCCSTRPCCTGLSCQAGQCLPATYATNDKALFVWNPVPPDLTDELLGVNNKVLLCSSAAPAVCNKSNAASIPTWELLLQNFNGTADTLIDFCVQQHFTNIYLFIGATQYNWQDYYSQHTLPYETGISYLIQKAQQQQIAVWAFYYLNDNTNSIIVNSTLTPAGSTTPVPVCTPTSTSSPNPDDCQKALDLVQAVHAYNQRNPQAKFVGLIGDQEPSSPAVYANFLAINAGIKQQIVALNANLKSAITITPTWITDTTNGVYNGAPFYQALATATLSDLVTPVLDKLVVLAYSNDFNTVAQLAAPVIQALNPAQQIVEIAVETGWNGIGNSSAVSFNEQITTAAQSFQTNLINTAGTLLAPLPLANPKFTAALLPVGLAIHDFAQYFVDLNPHPGITPYCAQANNCTYDRSNPQQSCSNPNPGDNSCLHNLVVGPDNQALLTIYTNACAYSTAPAPLGNSQPDCATIKAIADLGLDLSSTPCAGATLCPPASN